MSSQQASVDSVVAGYQAAVAARDIHAFMNLYDPAVRVFDAWGVWSYEGVAAWQVAIEGWFASHPTDRFRATFDDVATVSSPAFNSVTAIVTYAVVTANGEPLQSLQNRLTWVLKASEQGWRIIHEHTSLPVGFEDHKAILRR